MPIPVTIATEFIKILKKTKPEESSEETQAEAQEKRE